MQVETLRDVLYWTQTFHQHLSKCLSKCSDKTTDERAKMVLAYLADHEKSLSKVVKSFEQKGDEHALNTWCYEYVQRHPITRHAHCSAPFVNLNAEQAMDVIVEQHEQIIELYRYLSSRAEIPAAKEMLSMLSAVEEHELMRMVQSTNRFSDM